MKKKIGLAPADWARYLAKQRKRYLERHRGQAAEKARHAQRGRSKQ